MNQATEADAVAALAAKAGGASVVKTDDGRAFLVLPEGFSQTEVTDAYGLKAALPRYVKQTVTIETADSLVDYVNRFKVDSTVLFAEIASDTIIALLDYHPTTQRANAGENPAKHVAHRAKLKLPLSLEWAQWKSIDERLMGQNEFARWLEENAGDVAAPSAADLLEVCKDLQAVRKASFKAAVRTNSLTEDFQYSTETDARTLKGLELPTQFKLSIPVYFGGANVSLYAYLRWKINDDGVLTLGIKLSRAEHVRQAEFKQVVLDIAARTECPTVFGKSEN